MDTAVIRDILEIILIGSFFCALPLFVIGGLIYSTIIKFRQRTAHQELAKAIGFSPVNRTADVKQTWYGGFYKGRMFALSTFTSAYTYYYDGRSRRGFNVKLRIMAEVHVKDPLGIKVYRNKNEKIAQNFDDAFIVEGGTLSSPARDAMLAFAYRGHKKGLLKDLRYRFTHGMRNLSLSDRDAVPSNWMIKEALADANAILTHDHPFVDLTPDEFKTILDEMDAVAQAVETDRLPPLLAGSATPPPEDKGKYAYWAYLAFLILGIPGCICICGMLIVSLG